MMVAMRVRCQGDGGGWMPMEGDEMPHLSVIPLHPPPSPSIPRWGSEVLG